MNYSELALKRCYLVLLGGDTTGDAAGALRDNLQRIMDHGDYIPSTGREGVYRIVIDMSKVTKFSSLTLGKLCGAQRACRRYNRGQIKLAGINPQVDKTLTSTEIKSQFPIYDTAAEAVGDF